MLLLKDRMGSPPRRILLPYRLFSSVFLKAINDFSYASHSSAAHSRENLRDYLA
jgi:hypothetical protein